VASDVFDEVLWLCRLAAVAYNDCEGSREFGVATAFRPSLSLVDCLSWGGVVGLKLPPEAARQHKSRIK